uniref:Uncharacterized protein n=1 Tax=Fagus sylvatica TaxID=28930 RepID=A0A2N9HSJ5_FAGSY
MEVKNAKGGTYPLALFVMLILLFNAYCCGAAVLVKGNTTVHCNGRLDECLIEDELELVFLTNPYISRMLANGKPHPTIKAVQNRNKPACGGTDCSKGCKKTAYKRAC